MLGKNVSIKSENLLKKKMNKKDAIEILNKLRDSNSFTKNSISNIEYAKSECYDEEGNLLFTMQIKDSKVITETQKIINENIIKMIYIINDIDADSGLIETYINGKLSAIMRMKNSLPNGEAKIFYPSGKLLSIFTLVNGKTNGIVKVYYENGKIKSEINYSYDLKEGLAKTYYLNGNVEAEGNFENGEEIGTTRVYYENGKLKEEIPYTNGVINGHHIQYSENGKVLKKTLMTVFLIVIITSSCEK